MLQYRKGLQEREVFSGVMHLHVQAEQAWRSPEWIRESGVWHQFVEKIAAQLMIKALS